MKKWKKSHRLAGAAEAARDGEVMTRRPWRQTGGAVQWMIIRGPSGLGKQKRLAPRECALSCFGRIMATPRVLLLPAPRPTFDAETQFAFDLAGPDTERLHVNRLRENPGLLRRFQILAVPGGFTYGDDVAAGKILGNQLAHFLGDELRTFRDRERLI